MRAETIADRRGGATRWRRVVRCAWQLGSPLALLGACGLAGLRLNLTGSLPIGLYRVSRAAPVREAIVLACLPPAVAAFARTRGYLPRGGQCRTTPAGRVERVSASLVAAVSSCAIARDDVPIG